ncbi:MAG: GNAT family N-acetyltransferase [Muribaculaceae bacterium]|nr:GNAT family N-acetyltransferase [Muribaculaceae bacterium]MCM1493363.1 GNAT family N-acetyltransferase [Muribaculaceae bacterium]
MGTLEFTRVTRDVEQSDFDCGVASINQYVKESYFPTIAQHAYAYAVMARGTIVGYYMLMFREIELEIFPEEIAEIDPGIKDERLSAVHIRYLAIDKRYQGNKIGTSVLHVVMKQIEDLAGQWPIRVITIDAREDLLDWYAREGFRRMLKNSPGQDGITTAMFFDCMKFSGELADYINENCM